MLIQLDKQCNFVVINIKHLAPKAIIAQNVARL